MSRPSITMACQSKHLLWALVISALAVAGAMLAGAGRSGHLRPPLVEAAAVPDQVHLSWVGNTHTTMAVTWRTSSASSGPYVVQWGPSSGSYSGGQTTATNETAPGNRGVLHKAQITGLQPNTLYHYRVAGDSGNWSNDLTFRTAPVSLPETGVTFTINGDLGPSNTTPKVGVVFDQLATENAAFHLLAGDLTYAASFSGTATEEYFFANDLSRISSSRPVMAAWGNHEYDFGADTNIGTITRYFQLPEGQANTCNPFPYYSFRYASIHFVALDDNVSTNTCFNRTAQQAWLRQDLAVAAADPSVKWKVVFLHRPPFSGGRHGSDVVHRYEEFDQYGVDLVVSGHDHNYERTWPVNWNGTKIGSDYDGPAYPTYVVAGTGGAPRYTEWTANPWSAYHDSGGYIGYLRVTATPSQLVGEFIGKSSPDESDTFGVRDSFTIRKPGDGAWLFPWYDNSGMTSWVLAGNPSTTESTNCSFSIGGVERSSHTIPPGSRTTPQYAGLIGGPVNVDCDKPVFASERSIFSGSFNETFGSRRTQLTNVWWFPWYDNAGLHTWILIGNPSSSKVANCTVNIDGVQRSAHAIPPGASAAPQYSGLIGGPVKVECDRPVFASERTIYKQSFHEVTGIAQLQLMKIWWFPWYDNSGMQTWLLIGNPSATQAATCSVIIHGVQLGTYTVPPGSRVIPEYAGLVAGPVQVACDQPVFATERSIYKNSFNEVTGTTEAQLADTWWFPWYDNSGMATWVMVGNPEASLSTSCAITVGGVVRSSPVVGSGTSAASQYVGLINGPVKVKCDKPVFASQRVIYKSSFNEVMGARPE